MNTIPTEKIIPVNVTDILPALEEAEIVLRLHDSGMDVAHGRTIDAGKKLLELITKLRGV